jgi:molybdenum cofactor cytidylyltransferase
MGRDKALLPWPPRSSAGSQAGTFLSAAIQLLQPYTQLVIVVAGKNADSIAPVVYAHGAFLAVNRAPERGQFSSLQVGLQEVLNHGRDAAIVALVDRPPAQSRTVDLLCLTFAEAIEQERWAVIPEYGGKHGHPILVGREMIETFLKAPPTASARDVEHSVQPRMVYLPVDDPRVVSNVDTPEDYAALQLQ